ncbi:glycine zipper 2TM domain-containing protein [Fulvimonas soli]|jgi:outer membrane lipoprotein SlyB|uniref:Outer membrane lipoprotein SlyB n=1 Tax=Fulvimonas soli TaxID=155197 RepID=A0A316IIL3_9GAMM|nr:glycine zipper 2TM domain-containing protein [Fulvimonas soli]PWK92933.1 outer membrane lipoprotein SlyB [Fulvimonas soli]TNY26585.1 hypothetical protein BV497_08090 [Fulvimonas soli]
MTVRFNGWALASMLVASLALAGCETSGPRYGTTYSSSGYGYNGGRCSTCGVVQSVQQVYVQGGNNGTLGAVIGAVAGGVLGNTVGKGDGRKAATVGGAVVGGVVGNQVGKNSGGGDVAWRVEVRLDNGQYATVTQREDPGVRNGDYVEVRGDRVYAR